MKNTYMENLINTKTNKNKGEILAINSYEYSKRKIFDSIIKTLYFENNVTLKELINCLNKADIKKFVFEDTLTALMEYIHKLYSLGYKIGNPEKYKEIIYDDIAEEKLGIEIIIN